MKLQILSDLHIEFEDFQPPVLDSDIVILAGDIHLNDKGLLWVVERFPNKPVLYVLGNHEYYGKAYPKLIFELKEKAKGTNVTILENDVSNIKGVNFFGCSLWTDFKLYGDPKFAGYEATQMMTDYKKIKLSYPTYHKLRSVDTANIHHKSLNWLKGELEKYNNSTNVVITHHAPSLQSVPDIHKENILSAAYASNLKEFIEKSNIKLWIHGHIHRYCEYFINKTKVLCNPKGYPDESDSGFISNLVVKI